MATAPEQPLLQVHDLEVDGGRQQVSRHGTVLKLPGLSWRLFMALIEAAPNVLTVDDLIDKVWDGRIVSPETITQRVKLLRQVLGDDAQNPTYIGVVRGGGYYLLASVTTAPEPTTGDENLTRGLVGELSRRRVPQVALVYAAVAWTFTEALAFIFDALPLFPSWSRIVIALLFITGFPVAMFLAWSFDLGPDGVRRTEPMTRRGRLTIASALGLMLLATSGLSYLLVNTLAVPTPTTTESPATATPIDIVALLPFTFATQDPTQQRLGAGLNDELRDNLRDVGLKMVARTSSRALANEALLVTDISKRLGAGTLIEGVIRPSGDNFVLSLSIVDGRTGVERWSARYDGSHADLPRLQKDIANAVLHQLMPGYKVPNNNRTMANPTAYNLLLLGRHFEQEVRDQLAVDGRKLAQAIDLYQQAVTADSSSVLAYSRLASALLYAGDVQAAKPAILKAVDMNAESADVQYALGSYYWQLGDPRGGAAFAKAVELDPNHVDALAAHAKWIWHQQIFDQPIAFFEKARQLDPLSLARYTDLGTAYAFIEDIERTQSIAKQVTRKFPTAAGYEVAARLYELTGELDVAIQTAHQGTKLGDLDRPDAHWQLAELYARLGDHDTAERLIPQPDISRYFWSRQYRLLADLAEERIIDRPEESKVYYQLAFAYNTQGQHAAAARILQLAGLPDAAFSDSRRADAVEAMATYADALMALEQREEAKKLAQWLRSQLDVALENGARKSWWPNAYQACALLILDEVELALTRISAVAESNGLAWEPFMRDAICFQAVAQEPVYLNMLARLQERKARQRDRLALIDLEQAEAPSH